MLSNVLPSLRAQPDTSGSRGFSDLFEDGEAGFPGHSRGNKGPIECRSIGPKIELALGGKAEVAQASSEARL
jgi:hypothetical protein